MLSELAVGPPRPLAELVPEVPRDLLAIVNKAMARPPADRYPSAREMARELERFLTGGLVAAHQYTLGELLRRFVRRQRTAVLTAALAVVLLAGVGVWSLWRIAEQRNRAEQARQAAEQSAVAEGRARREAEHRLDQALLAAARTAVDQDPTLALGLLKRLRQPVPGAASVAADAQERGVAWRVLGGHEDRIDVLAFSPDGRWLASGRRPPRGAPRSRGPGGVARVVGRRHAARQWRLGRHRTAVGGPTANQPGHRSPPRAGGHRDAVPGWSVGGLWELGPDRRVGRHRHGEPAAAEGPSRGRRDGPFQS